MTESQESSNSWMWWLIAAIVGILVVALLLLAVFLANSSNDADINVVVTPISGGVAVPESIAESSGPDGVEDEVEPLAVGSKVTSISLNGFETRIFSDADTGSFVRDKVVDGAVFVVMESSDEYDDYPVRNGDENWYRVRATDGLVGWALAEHLVPIE